MRDIIVSDYLTVDGYSAGPGGEIDRFVRDDEMAAYSRDLPGPAGTILFGRITDELMAGYRPTATGGDPSVAERMNAPGKIVFSRTLPEAGWNNTSILRGIDPAGIRRRNELPGKDMVICGSGVLVRALTNLGPIDRYLLFVNPVVPGAGKPLFRDTKERLRLVLSGARVFLSGIVTLGSRPAGAGAGAGSASGPGGTG